jgi:hypothetical protein
MRGHLTSEQKQLAFPLKAQGMSLAEIGREVGCSAPMVGLMVRTGRFTAGIHRHAYRRVLSDVGEP